MIAEFVDYGDPGASPKQVPTPGKAAQASDAVVRRRTPFRGAWRHLRLGVMWRFNATSQDWDLAGLPGPYSAGFGLATDGPLYAVGVATGDQAWARTQDAAAVGHRYFHTLGVNLSQTPGLGTALLRVGPTGEQAASAWYLELENDGGDTVWVEAYFPTTADTVGKTEFYTQCARRTFSTAVPGHGAYGRHEVGLRVSQDLLRACDPAFYSNFPAVPGGGVAAVDYVGFCTVRLA